MKHKMVLLMMVIAVSTVVCATDKELSRSKAKELIENSKKFKEKRPSLILSQQEVNCGTPFNWWESNGSAAIPANRWQTRLVVKRHVTEILGIQDWPGSEGKRKYTKYTWTFDMDDWPAGMKSCFENNPKMQGQAIFSLYDDGWRVERSD